MLILFELKLNFWNPLIVESLDYKKKIKNNNFDKTVPLQLDRSVKHTHIQTNTQNYGATSSVAQFFHPGKLYLI